eukprot:jgi/Mesvir1/14293/Mv09719-RA.1
MPLQLRLDDQQASKCALLVANYCKKFGTGFKCVAVFPKGATEELPRVVDPHSGLEVCGSDAVSRFLARNAGEALSQQLLGNNAGTSAQVSQWLSLCNTELSLGNLLGDAAPGTPASRLTSLDEHLQPRVFLAGSRLSLADLVVFAAVHPAMSVMPATTKQQLCSLSRWFDHIQCVGDVEDVFMKLVFTPLKFAPPALVAKAAAPAAAKDAVGADAGKQKGDKAGKVAAPAANGVAEKAAEKPAPASSPASEPAAADAKKDKKEKKEKEKEEKAVGGEGGGGDMAKKEIDISVLKIQVGRITKVWKHPDADSLYVENIDLGEPAQRQVVSGLVKFVPEDQMLNRRVLVLTNAKPGNLRNQLSQGVVLCAANADHTVVQPVEIPEGVPLGETVTFEGYPGEPADVLIPKKKQFETLMPDLHTDEAGVAKFRDTPFMTSKGPCFSSLKNAPIK